MAPENATASPEVLNSWKEIAAYLDRDVRTVMRWEETRGLPVHRLPGGAKSAVYALTSEIDAWRNGRKASFVEAEEQSNSPAASTLTASARPWKSILLPTVTAVLLALAATAVWQVFHGTRGIVPYQLTRLTYERTAAWPAISADGKLVAYASERDGQFDIYVQQLAGHQPIRVTHNQADNFQPSLSPDGSRLAFRSELNGGGLYIAETLGGSERKIVDRGAYPAFSPDGSTILYLIRDAFSGNAKMFLIPADGGLGHVFEPDFELPPTALAVSVPMWSPDGRNILFEGIRNADSRTRGLWVASLAGGPATSVGSVPSPARGAIRIYTTWAGRHLYYTEGTSVQGMPLMRVPLSPNPWRFAGPPEQVTSSSAVCGSARVADNGRLALMITSFVNNVWSASLAPNRAAISGALKQETTGTDNKLAMSVASDGSRLAYTNVLEVGHMEMQLIDLHTRHLTALPLSPGNLTSLIRLSPDGSRLAYRDYSGGKLVSYNVDATNPGPTDPICEGCSLEAFFSGSEDVLVRYGQQLVRQSASKVVRNTLIEFPVRDPSLSPDDQWLAFVAPRPDASAGIFVAPVSGQAVPPQQWILVAEDRNAIGSPRWSPAGNFLYYISNRDSFSCVWAQSFDPAKKTFGYPIHVYHNQGFPSLRVNPTRSIGVTRQRLYMLLASMTSNIWTTTVASR